MPYEAVWLGTIGILSALNCVLLPLISANVNKHEQLVRFTTQNDVEAYMRISIKVNIFAIIVLLIKMWVKSEKR